jgi:hypothetical protein
MRFFRIVRVVLVAVLLLAIVSAPAYAYLDPGSGSYLLQILLAGLLGALFTLKVFWKRIVSFFAQLFSKRPRDDQDA